MGQIKRAVLSPLLVTLILLNAAVLLVVGIAVAKTGSIGQAIACYLRGETLVVDATEKSFAGSPGETVRVSFNLANRGDHPIRIVGCRALCNCTLPRDLPYTLGAGDRKELVLTVKIPDHGPGRPQMTQLRVPLTVFTTSGTQSRIALSINGDVRIKSSAADSAPL